MFQRKERLRGEDSIVTPASVVSSDGRGVLGHTGSRLLADLADAAGFVDAVASLRQRAGGHAPGRVALDVAGPGAVPDRVLPGAAEDRDGVSELGAGGQRPVRSSADVRRGISGRARRTHPR